MKTSISFPRQITVKENVSETGQGDAEEEEMTEKSCGITITVSRFCLSINQSNRVDRSIYIPKHTNGILTHDIT